MIGWMWRSRNAPVVCISVRRVCHCRKQSGSRKRAASGRIFSLAFPATLWNLRDQPRVAARIIFFLAPSSPRLRNRHSARRRGLRSSPKFAARFRFPCSPSAGLPWRTPPSVLPPVRRGSRPFAFFRTHRTCPSWSPRFASRLALAAHRNNLRVELNRAAICLCDDDFVLERLRALTGGRTCNSFVVRLPLRVRGELQVSALEG